MHYELSIIIPFYNISWFLLKECLDSILPQVDEKTELIILNDGSSEREAIETCKNYVKNCDSVYVIDRKENKGVSATRNEGISYSHGKFLIFVDADDMLEQNALTKIRNVIRENSTIDTVFYEYSLLKDENKVPCFRKINAVDCKHFTLKMAERMILGIDFNSPCTIAYSKKIIDDNKLSFDTEMALGEDFKFNTQYLQLYSNGTYIKESLYLTVPLGQYFLYWLIIYLNRKELYMAFLCRRTVILHSLLLFQARRNWKNFEVQNICKQR